MKVNYELKQGYIDIWNEESEEWDRYIKVNKKTVVEEEKKLPEKINVKGSYNSNKGYEDFNDNEKILVDKINDLLDYLESKEKGE